MGKFFKKRLSYKELEERNRSEHELALMWERDYSVAHSCLEKLYQMVEEAQDLQTLKSTAQKLLERFCEANGTVYRPDYVQRAEDKLYKDLCKLEGNNGQDDSGDA